MERDKNFGLCGPGIFLWENCKEEPRYRVEAHSPKPCNGGSVIARTSNGGMEKERAIRVAKILF